MERDDPRTVARLQFFFWAHCAATENMEIEPWICFLRRNSLGYSNFREYADAYMAALGVMLLDCKKIHTNTDIYIYILNFVIFIWNILYLFYTYIQRWLLVVQYDGPTDMGMFQTSCGALKTPLGHPQLWDISILPLLRNPGQTDPTVVSLCCNWCICKKILDHEGIGNV